MTAGMPSFPAYAGQLDRALAFMQEGEHYLIVSHVQPDGDAISSTLVTAWLLAKLGKTFVMMNESAVPLRLGYLQGTSHIQNMNEVPEEIRFDRVIAVDCADYKRIGLISERFAPGCELLNIDHHPTNDHFGTVNLIRADAAATVEILYDLIEHAGISLDVEAGTAVYTGLLTDTGGFRYSSTSPRVMQIASAILMLGVSGHLLAEHLLEKMTKAQLLLLQRGLANLTFSSDNRIAWITVGHADLAATGATSEDLEGLVNYARNVEGVDVGMLFKEAADGCVKVSLRSSGAANVSAIAQTFGGGGHVRAAGCRLDMSMTDAVQQIVQAVSEALKA
ncbi:bifunctional oligoribonuclease/PAP phosphatase NrnA [Paenibacillus aurantiacus]|uniref:Bifunctional oligoribonuclease/PAP phosphatase NrnA n=1 Tax=Paenibacillus aurantiacus TaxID=1936118 RepID=A0ABV5KXW8_9BACL